MEGEALQAHKAVYASSLRFLRRCPRSLHQKPIICVIPICVQLSVVAGFVFGITAHPSLRPYSFVENFFSVRSSRCVVFSARCINWRSSVARFLLREGMVVYSAGLFVTVSPGSIEIASSHCSKQGKTYCMNLSAPFIMQVPPFKAVLMKKMPDVDVQPIWRSCLPTP